MAPSPHMSATFDLAPVGSNVIGTTAKALAANRSRRRQNFWIELTETQRAEAAERVERSKAVGAADDDDDGRKLLTLLFNRSMPVTICRN